MYDQEPKSEAGKRIKQSFVEYRQIKHNASTSNSTSTIATLSNDQLKNYKTVLEKWFDENQNKFLVDNIITKEWSINQRKLERIEAEIKKRNIL